MAPLLHLLLSFGNAGAVANARRSCEERRLAEARVDALARRLAAERPASAPAAGPSWSADRHPASSTA